MRLGGRCGGWLELAVLGLAMLPAASRAQEVENEGGGFAGGQRIQGTVMATTGYRLTVKTEAGETYQVVTTTNTRVMKDREPVKVAAIPVGSGVGAMGLLDAPTKTVHAMVIFVVDPEQVKKAREGLGKVYIVGKVTKIEETTLTLERPDGVVQKIEVDEGTSFKRGRRRGPQGGGMGATGADADAGVAQRDTAAESITLVDLKVGDLVGGQGGLKNGLFVPKELTVMAPGAGRRRRGELGAEAAGTGATGARTAKTGTAGMAGQAPR